LAGFSFAAKRLQKNKKANGASGLSSMHLQLLAAEFGPSSLILSRNVDHGAKNKLPVTGLLKSNRRSKVPGGRPTNMFCSIVSVMRAVRL